MNEPPDNIIESGEFTDEEGRWSYETNALGVTVSGLIEPSEALILARSSRVEPEPSNSIEERIAALEAAALKG